jgi:DNA mismatch endonuclease (patch repair protein)
MADVHDRETRSYNMSKIRSKNTKPELLVRKFLHANGFRYRLHVSNVKGKPDIILPKYNTVIFVHGCFWHQHNNCKFAKTPENNYTYWLPKLEGNAQRDKKHANALKREGWKVIIIWTCKLNSKNADKTLHKLIQNIKM